MAGDYPVADADRLMSLGPPGLCCFRQRTVFPATTVTLRFSIVAVFDDWHFFGNAGAMNSRFIVLKAIGASLTLVGVYLLSYAPVVNYIIASRGDDFAGKVTARFYAPLIWMVDSCPPLRGPFIAYYDFWRGIFPRKAYWDP